MPTPLRSTSPFSESAQEIQRALLPRKGALSHRGPRVVIVVIVIVIVIVVVIVIVIVLVIVLVLVLVIVIVMRRGSAPGGREAREAQARRAGAAHIPMMITMLIIII